MDFYQNIISFEIIYYLIKKKHYISEEELKLDFCQILAELTDVLEFEFFEHLQKQGYEGNRLLIILIFAF